MILLLSFFLGCAGTSEVAHKEVSSPPRPSSQAISNISGGLPQSGLWRQNIALADMDGDGFLDIVAPPPRKAKREEERPFVFLWDNKEGKWKEGGFSFPAEAKYAVFSYGGIAVGDIQGGGSRNIVLAVHAGGIALFEDDKKNGFIERPFSTKDVFHSRSVEVVDINGDGRPDIIALSESSFENTKYKRQGLLVGLNKGNWDWDIKSVEGSAGLSGDFFAVGDFRGKGNKDIIICEENGKTKLVWFGDGEGNFKEYDNNFIGELWPRLVRAGDIDGDGKDEVVFKLMTRQGKVYLAAFQWTGESFADISAGLESVEEPVVFDLADLDGSGKKELVVLTRKGIGIYTYLSHKWVEKAFYPVSSYAEVGAAYSLRAGRNRDGSVLIAYNLGADKKDMNHGIRAYLLK